ncbi:hypothetical protein G9A89_006661 [Geosiphon pyriformis]|nr:hypothetical protein G9A89_006661 [Geosiphon pyriformis]
MSDGRSVSLQSSVGTTSAEELAEKYQKLFQDFSKIKAQQTVLKKAVIKEQATNSSLQEELKTKEHELRTSLQQLDLLTFHNQRLTKRIESLQDSGNARLAPGWLLGSTKKELEKSKSILEANTKELQSKIEENEQLHKDIYEAKGLYNNHVNMLQTKLSELEKKTEDLQVELTRSHLAGEEALNIVRDEKRRFELELEQTRAELQQTKALLEENENKMRDGEDSLRIEIAALRDTLSINLGLSEDPHFDKFNTLYNKIDSEANEIISGFRQLQASAREYLKALKENSHSSHSLGLQMKSASQAWHQNLQNLAVKLASSQNQIQELAAEKEKLAHENETNARKVSILNTEILRLKELEKQYSVASIQETNGAKIVTTDVKPAIITVKKVSFEDNSVVSEKVFNPQSEIAENSLEKHQQNEESEITDHIFKANEVNGELSHVDLNSNQILLSSKETDDSLGMNSQKVGYLTHVLQTDEKEEALEKEIVESPPIKISTIYPADEVLNESDEEEEEEEEEVAIANVYTQNVSFGEHPIKETNGLNSTHQVAKHALSQAKHNIIRIKNPVDDTLSIVTLERDTGCVPMSEGDVNREALIKNHYESKIHQLREKLELVDSKTVRIYKALKVMQDKLREANNEKESFQQEIARLKTEKMQMSFEFEEEKNNYQKQVDMMTDFMNTLQLQSAKEGQVDEEAMGGTSRSVA